MHYVCIENDQVISTLNYRPNVPNTVSIVEITDIQASQLQAGTHLFDLASRSVSPVASSVLDRKEQEVANAQEREFLNSTDWKVLRHLRQKTLGLPTSLTDAEFLQLEQDRNAAASRIV